MKKPRFFSKIYLSMTSSAFYVTIIHEHLFKSFLYLVLLSILLSTPYSIYSGLLSYDKTSDTIEFINSENFPSFKLQDKKLEIYDDEPFVFSIEDKSIRVIIDKTNSYSYNDLAGYYMGYLFTPNNIVYSQLGTTPRSIGYDIFMVQHLDNNELVEIIQSYQTIFAIGYGCLALLIALISVLLKSLFSYFLVSFFKNLLRVPLSFSQSYKIAIYSMTTSIVIMEVLKAINFIPSQLFFGIFFFINSVYIGNILKYFSNLKTNISV
ncbi:MAG: hypothetical protein CVU84_16145 [Firmicutes bacterium HGW-Firmicutes-1]|jgi:hypothetical protein|nr:MAG: hypothetical protein CVU84_16145 [Firmicutes bacterium HGW-Firmicutes-1]